MDNETVIVFFFLSVKVKIWGVKGKDRDVSEFLCVKEKESYVTFFLSFPMIRWELHKTALLDHSNYNKIYKSFRWYWFYDFPANCY